MCLWIFFFMTVYNNLGIQKDNSLKRLYYRVQTYCYHELNETIICFICLEREHELIVYFKSLKKI